MAEKEQPRQARCLSGIAAAMCLADPSPSTRNDAEGGKQAALDSGELRLEMLGYQQELRRDFGLFTSLCSSVSLMAFSSGLTGTHTPSPCQM